MVKLYTEKKVIDIALYDFGDDGTAVWRVTGDGDARYVEGFMDDSVWTIVERAVRAYDQPPIVHVHPDAIPSYPKIQSASVSGAQGGILMNNLVKTTDMVNYIYDDTMNG